MVLYNGFDLATPTYATSIGTDWQDGTCTTVNHTHQLYTDTSFLGYNGIDSSICQGGITFRGDIDIDLRIRKFYNPHYDCEEFAIESKVNVDVPKSLQYNNFSILQTHGLKRSYKGGSNINISRALRENHENNYFTDFLYEMKQRFADELIKQAKEEGKRIARDMIDTNFNKNSESSVKNKILNECVIEIPSKEGKIFTSLGSIMNEQIEGSMLSFDFGKVREIIKKNKKKVFQEKMKSINIRNRIVSAKIKLEDAYQFWGIKDKKFSFQTEEEVDRELRALTLLRRLVKDEQFTKYMVEKYIDIPDVGDKNKIYRIHRDKQIEVLIGDKIQEKLCIHLNNCPKTDEVIARLMFAKVNPKELVNRSNVYKNSQIQAIYGTYRPTLEFSR